AVQILTGRGGWPMSMFLTPDLKPFYGGTYWPPTPRMGMPGFEQVLAAVNDAWQNRREIVRKQADELTGYLQSVGENNEEASGGPGTAAPAVVAPGTSASVTVESDREADASRSPGIQPDDARQILDTATRQ